MDWEYFLNRKYDLLQQNANADTTRANAGMLTAQAGANLDQVRAGLLPKQTTSDINLQSAQAALANATARQQDEETKYIGPKSLADIFATRQQGAYYGSEAAGNTIANRELQLGAGPNALFQASSGNPLLDAVRRRVFSAHGVRDDLKSYYGY